MTEKYKIICLFKQATNDKNNLKVCPFQFIYVGGYKYVINRVMKIFSKYFAFEKFSSFEKNVNFFQKRR